MELTPKRKFAKLINPATGREYRKELREEWEEFSQVEDQIDDLCRKLMDKMNHKRMED